MHRIKLEEAAKLDTSLHIAAPEFIIFQSYLAGPAIRLIALILDHFIFLVVMFALILLLIIASIFNFFSYYEELSGAALFVVFILLFVVYWFYFLLQEYFMRGRTFGKIVCGLRVMSMDGTSLDFFQIVLRNLLRFADMFPVQSTFFPAYSVGLLCAFLDPRGFRRLGDLAAGTVVIKESRSRLRSVPHITDPVVLELASQMSLHHAPSATLARAIHDFAASANHLHPLRLEEIALRVSDPLKTIFGVPDTQAPAVSLLLAAHTFLYQQEETDESPGSAHKSAQNSSRQVLV